LLLGVHEAEQGTVAVGDPHRGVSDVGDCVGHGEEAVQLALLLLLVVEVALPVLASGPMIAGLWPVLALSERPKSLMNTGLYAPGRNRTYDLALRRRTLYPLSYRRGRVILPVPSPAPVPVG
jgi:hypothetical protein